MNTNPSTQLTGLVEAHRILQRPQSVPAEFVRRLQAVQDLSAGIADILDVLGIESAVGASTLRPTIAGRAIIGTAVTVRKAPGRRSAALDAREGRVDMGEIEGANQLRPGDVLVMQGLPDVSAMGGIMATMCKRQGGLGAIVDGGVRDVDHACAIDFPMWSRDVTPITGKWRSVVAEINGPIAIGGRSVSPGDLVVADGTGVVFVPRELVAVVVDRIEAIGRKEDMFRAALAGTTPLADLVRSYNASQAADRGPDGADERPEGERKE